VKKQSKSKLLNSAVTPPSSIAPIKGIAEIPIPPVQPLPPGHRQIKVALALPSGRTWEARTATAVAGLSAFSALQGIQLGIVNLEGSMITKQRNDLVEHARKMGADYILFLDTDLVFEPNILIRLLRHDKDVVGATYNKRVPPYETLGKLKGDRPSDEVLRAGGLREAELLPGGCMLVRMSVYDRLAWPFYHESYQWDGDSGIAALKNFLRDNYSTFAPEDALAELDGLDKLKTWINSTWEMESKTKWGFWSEDLSFCRKCIKVGIQLWCDLDISFSLRHLGTHEVTCNAPPVPTVIADAIM
jgi:hypothetical protein